jgi:hypothetical protein
LLRLGEYFLHKFSLLLAAMKKIPKMAMVVSRDVGREVIIQGSSGFRRRGNGRSP